VSQSFLFPCSKSTSRSLVRISCSGVSASASRFALFSLCTTFLDQKDNIAAFVNSFACLCMQVNSQQFREQMERMLDNEDATFAGKDLAVLIRKKYGRSYDVQLIKKASLSFVVDVRTNIP
jgi:hypothetical protein